MKIWTPLLAANVASIASASAFSFPTFDLSSIRLDKRSRMIDVRLVKQDDTVVMAHITNTGSVPIRLLNKGTLLDDAPVEKFQVRAKWKGKVSFLGLRKRIKLQDLGDDAFTELPAGRSIDIDVNLAAFHDLSHGGDILVESEGVLPYALEGTNKIAQAISFRSNVVELMVNGTQASSVSRAVDLSLLQKRTNMDNDCVGKNRNVTKLALMNCSQLATRAAYNAITGPAAKFKEYFGTIDPVVRKNVSDRYANVAVECSTMMSGKTRLHCVDVYAACDGNTLAYTVPTNNFVINCPEYYTYLPVISQVCHGQDMASTTLHEMTHAPGVFSPGTSDFAYGYDSIKSLTTQQAVANADTYALYANSLYTKC